MWMELGHFYIQSLNTENLVRTLVGLLHSKTSCLTEYVLIKTSREIGIKIDFCDNVLLDVHPLFPFLSPVFTKV